MLKLFRRLREYIVSSFLELQKVIWPSRRDVVSHTATIVVTVIISVIILGLFDFGLTELLRRIVVSQ